MIARTFLVTLLVAVLVLTAAAGSTVALSPRQAPPPPTAAVAGSKGAPEADAAAAGGATLVGRNLLIHNENGLIETNPAVAYNHQRQEYLVVWYNDRAGCDDIRAQRVSAAGKLVGPAFYISAGCPWDRRYPDVVYNDQQSEYLVVWEARDTAGGYVGIRGRRVSGTGQVLGTSDIEIANRLLALRNVRRPAVAFASTPGKYLVVWEEIVTLAPPLQINQIEGQALSGSGSLFGSEFTIAGTTGTEELRAPDLAYNRSANGHLVVWQQLVGGKWDFVRCLVDGDGPPPSFTPTSLTYTKSLLGPAVAALPTNPGTARFLAVWEYAFSSTDHDIKAGAFTADGTGSSSFVVTAALANESDVAVAASERSKSALITWTRSGMYPSDPHPIYGQTRRLNGTPTSAQVQIGGYYAEHSAVAAGPRGDFLVVFDNDHPLIAGDRGIYGQVWGRRVYLPLVLRNY